jgi:prophage regulatory protein
MRESITSNRHERRPSLAMLRKANTAKKCGVVTRTIDRWAFEPAYAHLNFPKPIQLGPNSVAWFEHEIDEWLIRRSEARDDG